MAKELKDHNYYGIDSTIVADSINEFGDRITTFVVTHPRHILAEMNTHRMFSRNSASSRAIPAKEMIRRVREQPFIPIAWQKEHSGMQGTEYITDEFCLQLIIDEWKDAAGNAVVRANRISSGIVGKEGTEVTKQITNRLLEPFLHHTAIITATEYENFFKLRCPQYYFEVDDNFTFIGRSRKEVYKQFPESSETLDTLSEIDWLKRNAGMGEIHIMALAESMWDNYNENQPKLLKEGEYHLPFGDQIDYQKLLKAAVACNIAVGSGHPDEDVDECMRLTIEDAQQRVIIARCARISYGTFEGKEDYEADIKLYDRLLSSQHLSPFEHVAKAMTKDEYYSHINGKIKLANIENKPPFNVVKISNTGWCRNFKGFIQERAILDV